MTVMMISESQIPSSSTADSFFIMIISKFVPANMILGIPSACLSFNHIVYAKVPILLIPLANTDIS